MDFSNWAWSQQRSSALTPVGCRGTSVHLEVDAAAAAEDVGAGDDGATATEIRRLHGVGVEGRLVVAGTRELVV